MATPLPPQFCWTRFGTEAGEGIDVICARKELERVKNRGVFLWGIGNALGPSMRELVRCEACPEVLFSPMLTPARQADVAPPRVVAWRAGRDLEGGLTPLPTWSVVTSRAMTGALPTKHFALVCQSDTPITFDGGGPTFSAGALTNLLTGRSVGASQVTAVVKRNAGKVQSGSEYRLAFRARLVPPFFVRLEDPQPAPMLAAFGVRAQHVGGPPSH